MKMPAIMKTQILTFLPIICIASITGIQAHEFSDDRKGLSSNEYTLLLEPSHITDIRNGSTQFLEIANELLQTANTGARIQLDFEGAKTRRTRYLDTRDFDLFQNGYLVKEKLDLDETESADARSKVSLNYRSKNWNESKSKNVEARLLTGEMKASPQKLECEVSPKTTMFSHSSAIRFRKKDYRIDTFSALSNLFPGLMKAKINSKAAILPVNNFEPVETVVPGVIHFEDGDKIRMRLVFWQREQDGKSFNMAEFSMYFSQKSVRKKPEIAGKAKELFKSLRKHDWRALKQDGKGAIAYKAE